MNDETSAESARLSEVETYPTPASSPDSSRVIGASKKHDPSALDNPDETLGLSRTGSHHDQATGDEKFKHELSNMERRLDELQLEIRTFEDESDEDTSTKLENARAEKTKIDMALQKMLTRQEAAQKLDKTILDYQTELKALHQAIEKTPGSEENKVEPDLEILKISALEDHIEDLDRARTVLMAGEEHEGNHRLGPNRARTDVKFETLRQRMGRFGVRRNVQLEAEDIDKEFGHLNFLEEQFETLDWIMMKLGSRTDKSTPTAEASARLPAIPELKLKSWDEWRKDLGETTTPKHFAIDMLCEDPPPIGQDGRTSLRRTGNQNIICDPHTAQRPGIKSLPDSIRINSIAAQRILDALCDNALRFETSSHPLLVSKPFKILVCMEDDILEKLAEIEQEYLHRTEAGEEINPAEEVYGTDSRFPDELPFFMGFEWSKVTIKEVKEALDDFRCLKLFLDEYITPLREYLRQGDGPRQIFFAELWHLFTPGSLIYIKDKSIPQKIYQIIRVTGGRMYRRAPYEDNGSLRSDRHKPFTIDCYHLDHNGVRFVRAFRKFTIEKFSDTQPVASLPIVPFELAEREGLVNRDALVAQGDEFVRCTKRWYRYYEGRSLSRDPSGSQLSRPKSDGIGTSRVYSEWIASQVMIDFDRALQAMPDWTPGGADLVVTKAEQAELDSTYEDDSRWDEKLAGDFLQKAEAKWQDWDKNGEVPVGDDLLLLPDRVFGFVFRTRSWACLQLGKEPDGQLRLREVERRQDAWRDLEIEPGHKRIVQSLIDSHFEKNKSDDRSFDLVRDKGKGVIVLLHGVPGVGKTSTAECVAESNHRPLLPITCGDLGMTAPEVERRLQTDFQLAQAWNCVLLLDEADIFLAERTNQDVERNALVSVFLRVLEYYEGILFLTTNRVGAFDEAFRSRIHMALYYPPLDWLQTEKIWKSHIRRARERLVEIEFDEIELIRFAYRLFEAQQKNDQGIGPVWNGRQIRNAFQSAISLAKHDKDTRGQGSQGVETADVIAVTTSHFLTVATASNNFNTYLWRVKGGRMASDIHRDREMRDDAYSANPTQRTTNPFSMPQSSPSSHMALGRQASMVGQPYQTPFNPQQNPPFGANTGSPYMPDAQFQGQQAFGGQPAPMHPMSSQTAGRGVHQGDPFNTANTGHYMQQPNPFTGQPHQVAQQQQQQQPTTMGQNAQQPTNQFQTPQSGQSAQQQHQYGPGQQNSVSPFAGQGATNQHSTMTF